MRNPYSKLAFGNYVGVGPYGRKATPEVYQVWMKMHSRVNDAKVIPNGYQNVTICEEWFNLQVFAEWYTNYLSKLNPDPSFKYQIDKDLMQINNVNKIYSPETCIIIPGVINNTLKSFKVPRAVQIGLPVGVYYSAGRYRAAIEYGSNRSEEHVKISLGSYATVEEAFNAYKKAKEAHIRDLAEKYYSCGAITEEVYNALINIDIHMYADVY